MSEKINKIPLARIHNAFDVREEPQTEEARDRRTNRILSFAESMDAGVKFPPLTVTTATLPGMSQRIPPDDWIIIDGRTRAAAMDVANVTEVDCVVKTYKTFAEAKAVAFRSNYGGAEPPTKSEMERIVLELTEERIPPTKIFKQTGIPVAVVTAIISKSRLDRIQGGANRKYREALAAVRRGGDTVENIANRFGVDIVDLRKRIVISERATRNTVSHAALKSSLTKAGRKFIHSLRQTCKTAFEAYQDEKNFNAEHVREVVQHAEKVLAEIQMAVSTNNQTAKRVLGEGAPAPQPPLGSKKPIDASM